MKAADAHGELRRQQVKKEVRDLTKALEKQGFEVTPSKSGHLIVRLDGRRIATLAGTPSDHRSWLNTIAVLRKAGFVWKR
ncbi:type II toxin-antitoxin system HicA family toxin [Kitasatospora sp. NPDC085879]|uniref:type II toxin-antitoxin system HicA family toxin n=1 Tax=Kitasatospora sp. NPDC085879 TaxID=3154769 RepID=UPI00343B9EEB